MKGWNLKGSFNEMTIEKKDEKKLCSYKFQGILELIWKNEYLNTFPPLLTLIKIKNMIFYLST